MAMFPKGFFKYRGPPAKPKKWSERPKLHKVRAKNAKRKDYHRFWPGL